MDRLTTNAQQRKIRGLVLNNPSRRSIVIDTRPIRLTNNIARRAWLRLVANQPKAYIAPRFIARVENERASKIASVPKKP